MALVLKIVCAFFHRNCFQEGISHFSLYLFILLNQLTNTVYFMQRSGSWTGGGGMWVELSGKMHVLARLLGHLRHKTDDRIVLVSNYTQVRYL